MNPSRSVKTKTLLLSVAIFLLLGWRLSAQSEDPEAIRFFEMKIRPVLAENCYKCHGEKKQKAGLRLDNLGYMLKGGSEGPVLVLGDSVKSHIFRAVEYKDPDYEMPPDGKLPDHQIADLKRWIEMGAPWPANEVIAARKPGEFSPEERSWWSFQPLMKVTPPSQISKNAMIHNEVDRFVVAKLDEAGLQQAAPAEPRELFRRLYFNLHGLPPTEEQIHSYLNDKQPDAYQRLVDDLLASPRYGMRWGQHWLDLVRYAESDGYREDGYRPHAWPYRDYVIRSFNQDKPYNQFVREQLAGDEINPGDPDILIGTAFLRNGIYEWNQADAETQRDLIIKEMPGLTGEVFLGMSIGCAECHDHKFDPILQRDYYRFKSFFSPMIWRDDIPLATAGKKKAHAQAMTAWEADSKAAKDAWDQEKIPVFESGRKKALAFFPPGVQAMAAKPDSELTPYEKQVLYLVNRRIEVEAGRALNGFKPKSKTWAAYKAFDDRKPKPLQPAFIATDVGTTAPPTKLKNRLGESIVEPGFLTILAPDDLKVLPLSDKNSTGRRTALADWITAPTNPLATRVIVNRVWQYHFGRGLSANASDFGKLGEAPSHPELLDWLTTGFIQNGWSFKWLHRQILNSATYRQSSLIKASPRANEVDPENKLLWRARPQRLDAEQIRDTLLALSGELTEKTGGPSEEGNKPVPSVFIRKERNSQDEMLSRFDAPPGFQSVAQRDATNTALQSLLMVNGEWPLQRARSMASQLFTSRQATDTDLAKLAITQIFGRQARPDEVAGGVAFLDGQAKQIEKSRPLAPPPAVRINESKWFINLAASDEPPIAFTPASDHEKILVRTPAVEYATFTLEAIVYLDSIQPDKSLRTIASRWNGQPSHKGWSLGITGEKSRFAPGQLVMELSGEDFQAALTLEVVASGLQIPPEKPYYISAILSAETLPGKTFGGHIRFLAKDLSDPAALLQETKIPHSLGGGYMDPDRALVIGGRDGQPGHLWSGGIQRLVMSNGPLTSDNTLLQRTSPGLEQLWELRSSLITETPDANFRWIIPPNTSITKNNPPKLEALSDLFHVLINSNEFLYQP